MTMRSPLAPDKFPELPAIEGLDLAVAASGLRYKNRNDLLLMKLCATATVAGVFTRSDTAAAPVIWSRNVVASGRAGAILTNAGNANAFTGERGRDTVHQTSLALAGALGISADQILLASTGVIGEPLESAKLSAYFPQLVANQGAIWEQAARAILTTDTFPKGAHIKCDIDGVSVNICGIAKGSGMIAPDMATMLGYLFTDAKVPQPDLQFLLTEINQSTFNAISVDSDTSTSDTVLLAATGKSEVAVTKETEEFKEGLHFVMRELAHLVVRDGEGASKFVEIEIFGAQNDQDAKTHAFAIANSPLVKTALAGSDPNWGRIVMAIGKSGAVADRDRIKIWFGDILVATDGFVAPSYTEKDGAAYMQRGELKITVDIGLGRGSFTAWTCDLTQNYVSINADYRS